MSVAGQSQDANSAPSGGSEQRRFASVGAIVYLHGFRSSPASIKATRLRAFVESLASPPVLHIPALQHRPAEAMRQVTDWVDAKARGDLTFVGSSLGGFYATFLAERYGARAVMINPAVRPYEALATSLGVQTNLYTGEAFEVTRSHMDELRAMAVTRITHPNRYFLLVETADEVLDYREAVAFYAGAFQYVRGGGNHTFTEFDAQIPAILRFAGIAAGAPPHSPRPD
ncbi:MAG: YqiA/YcfP family alpha/beta fold hydrolase [Burkholderiales bacterium]